VIVYVRKFIPLNKSLFGVIIPCILIAVYILSFKFNGFLDMPNHLARAFIMLKCIKNPGDALCDNYVIKILPTSYFFSDATLMLYLQFFPYLIAEKIAIFNLLVLFIISWYFLYKEINSSINIGYLAGLSLIINNYLYTGFYAYLISITLCLFWLTFWWKVKDNKTFFNQIFLSLGMAIIFGFHLAGFLFVFIIYFLYEIHRMLLLEEKKIKYLMKNSIKNIPIYITFFSLYFYQQGVTQESVLSPIHYKPLIRKIATILYPFINYSKWFDFLTLLLIFIILLLSVDIFSLRKFCRNFWTMVSATFFVFFLIAPTAAHGVYDFACRFLPIAYLALFIAIGSISKNKPVLTYAMIAILLINFTSNLYHKKITNTELSKIYHALKICPKNKNLIEINSIRNFPSQFGSRVNPFPYFSCYYILEGGALVSGLFDCKYSKHIPYFCYKNQIISHFDYFKYQFLGISKIDQEDFIKIAQVFDYVLVITYKNYDYIQSKLKPSLFSLIYKKDYIYLFKTKKHGILHKSNQ